MKIFVVSFLAVACATLSSGYDFSDPGFNALLTRDYEEFMNEDDIEAPLSYRSKREVEKKCGKNELPSTRCCKEAIEKPDGFEKVKEVKKQCFADIKKNRSEFDYEYEMFSCERINQKKEDLRCAYDCIARKQNIFSDANGFDPQATLDYFRGEMVDLPWVTAALEPVVNGCIAESNKVTASGRADEVAKCSDKPMKFLFCTWREFTKKCPADLQKDTKACNLIREGRVEFVHHQNHHHD